MVVHNIKKAQKYKFLGLLSLIINIIASSIFDLSDLLQRILILLCLLFFLGYFIYMRRAKKEQ